MIDVFKLRVVLTNVELIKIKRIVELTYQNNPAETLELKLLKKRYELILKLVKDSINIKEVFKKEVSKATIESYVLNEVSVQNILEQGNSDTNLVLMACIVDISDVLATGDCCKNVLNEELINRLYRQYKDI